MFAFLSLFGLDQLTSFQSNGADTTRDLAQASCGKQSDFIPLLLKVMECFRGPINEYDCIIGANSGRPHRCGQIENGAALIAGYVCC
jgi:hypothetical protein